MRHLNIFLREFEKSNFKSANSLVLSGGDMLKFQFDQSLVLSTVVTLDLLISSVLIYISVQSVIMYLLHCCRTCFYH